MLISEKAIVSTVSSAAKGSGNAVEGGLCFTGDTLIPTKDGYKKIKDIKVGDEVYSQNPETCEEGLKKVNNVFINETDELIHVFVGKEEINATPTHPFWVEDKGWVAAGELKSGDKVKLYNGQLAEVDKTIVEKLDNSMKVYNFEVEDWHTYFVSDSEVLVHNTCWVKNISKQESSVWKGFDNYKNGTKTTGKGSDKNYYEWDNTHNDIEVYNNNGNHLGSMNPSTGEMYKPSVKGRTIKLN